MRLKCAGSAVMLSAMGLLAGCSIGAGTAPAMISGSVSAGASLTGGTLIVTDSSIPPRSFTAPVLADGSYSVDVSNGTPPFLLHAQGRRAGRTVNLYSASAANSGKVNISPLTSLVVANAAGQDCAVISCTPPVFTAARLTDADMRVQKQLAPLLTQYGLAIADALDAEQGGAARDRKLVSFKHIAVGGYVYTRVPLEFKKDATTGNWRMAANRRTPLRANAKKGANTFTPIPGASSLGQSLSFSKESSVYPYGATLIMVQGSGMSPPVTLEYLEGENGAVRVAGAVIAEAVSNISFLPACPRPAGQSGSCVKVAQAGNGEYTATFSPYQAPAIDRAADKAGGPGV